jgi:hypothetical protein
MKGKKSPCIEGKITIIPIDAKYSKLHDQKLLPFVAPLTGGTKYLIKLDIIAGYGQIRVEKNSSAIPPQTAASSPISTLPSTGGVDRLARVVAGKSWYEFFFLIIIIIVLYLFIYFILFFENDVIPKF